MLGNESEFGFIFRKVSNQLTEALTCQMGGPLSVAKHNPPTFEAD